MKHLTVVFKASDTGSGSPVADLGGFSPVAETAADVQGSGGGGGVWSPGSNSPVMSVDALEPAA